MGNPDQFNTAKFLEEYEVDTPESVVNEKREILMYQYEILGGLKNGEKLAEELNNPEMKEYFSNSGYTLMDFDSDESRLELEKYNHRINEKLSTSGNKEIEVELRPGSFVMVERDDPSDPRRVVNVLFGIAKREKDGQTKYNLVTHPVGVDETGQTKI